jgi:hypothetical protein
MLKMPEGLVSLTGVSHCEVLVVIIQYLNRLNVQGDEGNPFKLIKVSD